MATPNLWATPTACDGKSGATLREYGNARPLREQVVRMPGPHDAVMSMGGESGSSPVTPLQLSPAFVEVLMGFPEGWTIVGDG